MEAIISNYFSKLQLGELQEHANMGIIPLRTSVNHSPYYLTLTEALEKRVLTVTEVSQGGSVPELKVTNTAELPVLLLDGEELVGAKQNRVLNTTILLKERTETKIPVSCTEQGRWAYSSKEFADSGVVASPRIRTSQAAAVTASLAGSRRYSSDQGALWNVIRQITEDSGVHSSTDALRDVFQSKMEDLDQYVKAFPSVLHQRGLFVFINGNAVGFDVVSLESACQVLHPKLIKSYALDAILQKKDAADRPSLDKATAFLRQAAGAEEKKYESVGHGWDYRFEGKGLVGSALVYREKVIHTAFFAAGESDPAGRISGYTRRRDFRI